MKKTILFILIFILFLPTIALATSTVSVVSSTNAYNITSNDTSLLNSRWYQLTVNTFNGLTETGNISSQGPGLGANTNISIFDTDFTPNSGLNSLSGLRLTDGQATLIAHLLNGIVQLVESGPIRVMIVAQNNTGYCRAFNGTLTFCVNYTATTYGYARNFMKYYNITHNATAINFNGGDMHLLNTLASFRIHANYSLDGTPEVASQTDGNYGNFTANLLMRYNSSFPSHNKSILFFPTLFNSTTDTQWFSNNPSIAFISSPLITERSLQFGWGAFVGHNGANVIINNATVFQTDFNDSYQAIRFPASISSVSGGTYNGRHNETNTYNFTATSNSVSFNFTTNGTTNHTLPVFNFRAFANITQVSMVNYTAGNTNIQLTSGTDYITQIGNSTYFGYNYTLLLYNGTLGLGSNQTYQFIIQSGQTPNITDVSFTANTTETRNTRFFFVFNTTENSSFDATLNWNNSYYPYSTRASITANLTNIWNFTREFDIPMLWSTDANTTNFTFFWNYSSNGGTTGSSTNNTQGVNKMVITRCAYDPLGNLTALNFTGFDEEGNNTLSHNFNGTFGIWATTPSQNRTYPFSFSGFSNYTICIYPSYENYGTNAFIDYDATGYSHRNYFLQQANISNSSSLIFLYLLQNSLSTQIGYSVTDASYIGVSNIVIQALRYFSGSNEYRMVSEALTDYQGQTATFLRTNNYYIFNLLSNGVVRKQFGPLFLTNVNLSFPLSTNDIASYFSYFDKVASGCNYNNASKTLTCQVIDTSGKMNTVFLNVSQQTGNSTIPYCQPQSTSSSAILSCTLANNGTYTYTLTAKFCCSNPTIFQLASGFISVLANYASSFGLTGVFTAFVLIFVFSMAGMWHPIAGITMGIAGFVLSYALGLLNLTPFTGTSIMFIIITGTIIAYKLEHR